VGKPTYYSENDGFAVGIWQENHPTQ